MEEGKTQAPLSVRPATIVAFCENSRPISLYSFLGTQLQLALWGILLIKGVEYYYHHRRDSLAGFWAVSLSLALQSCQVRIRNLLHQLVG